jgi:hypothetical protein
MANRHVHGLFEVTARGATKENNTPEYESHMLPVSLSAVYDREPLKTLLYSNEARTIKIKRKSRLTASYEQLKRLTAKYIWKGYNGTIYCTNRNKDFRNAT